MKYTLFNANVFDALPNIPTESVDLVITSPPYWGLRDYGVEGQFGSERTLEEYLDRLMVLFKETERVLKPTGSLVLNLGGCYLGGGRGDSKSRSEGRDDAFQGGHRGTSAPNWGVLKKNGNRDWKARTSPTSVQTDGNGKYKKKQFIDMAAFAYTRIISETNFVCRNRGVWCKPNVPSPIRSRLKQSWEAIDWYVKDADKVYFDARPWMVACNSEKLSRKPKKLSKILKSGRTSCFFTGLNSNKETIAHSWRVIPVGEKQQGFELSGKEKQDHIAPFPETLVKPWIESLCQAGGTVLDPFSGSGTVMKIARDTGRNAIGIEINPAYTGYSKKRLNWKNGIDGHEYLEEFICGTLK